MDEKDKYMVATRCMTYNQAPYIGDALHGFAMQETAFPVVYIIVDDASTDGEPDVLRRWAENNIEVDGCLFWNERPYGQVLEGKLKGKRNSTFVFLLLTENHTKKGLGRKKLEYIKEWSDSAKYIASCEGDDYWTAPDKLSKQVGFLENNPEFSECGHRFWVRDERGISKNVPLYEYEDHKILGFSNEYGVKGFVYDIDNYWEHWYSQPLSVVLRNMPYIEAIPRDKYKYFRDVIQHYYAMRNGKGMLLEELMGVYRKTRGGVFAGNALIDNARITNDNLRTIYEVEGDERVLPVLRSNVIMLWRDAVAHFQIKKSFSILKLHYKLIPKKEVIPFTKQLMAEPFMILKRKINGNDK